MIMWHDITTRLWRALALLALAAFVAAPAVDARTFAIDTGNARTACHDMANADHGAMAHHAPTEIAKGHQGSTQNDPGCCAGGDGCAMGQCPCAIGAIADRAVGSHDWAPGKVAYLVTDPEARRGHSPNHIGPPPRA